MTPERRHPAPLHPNSLSHRHGCVTMAQGRPALASSVSVWAVPSLWPVHAWSRSVVRAYGPLGHESVCNLPALWPVHAWSVSGACVWVGHESVCNCPLCGPCMLGRSMDKGFCTCESKPTLESQKSISQSKTPYGRSLRRQHTTFLTVILTLTLKSGFALSLASVWTSGSSERSLNQPARGSRATAGLGQSCTSLLLP